MGRVDVCIVGRQGLGDGREGDAELARDVTDYSMAVPGFVL